MATAYQKVTQVKWAWGTGEGRGRIVEVATRKITRTLKGSEITRNASEDEPAYVIEQDDGDRVLKSHTEVEKA